jgi:chromosome segregation ATPase
MRVHLLFARRPQHAGSRGGSVGAAVCTALRGRDIAKAGDPPDMRIMVLVCGALLALAVAFEVYSSEYPPTALIELVQSQPLMQKLAWAVIIVMPFGLLAGALWESARLDQQRKANEVWETRFRGVRKAADELDDAQKDIDRATSNLERSDPEDALSALQRRLIEAERTTHLQQSRNEKEGLLARIEMARQQQQVLREKLGETIEKRRLIEPLFVELQNSQDVLEKGLTGLKADDLNDRLQALMQSTERMKTRCEEIERMLAAFVRLKGELDALKNRLAPLDDKQNGVKSLVNALNDIRDQLTSTIERLDHDGDATLAERAAKFAESRQAFDERVAGLIDQFAKLDGVNRDIRGLFAKLRGEVDAQLLTFNLGPQ